MKQTFVRVKQNKNNLSQGWLVVKALLKNINLKSTRLCVYVCHYQKHLNVVEKTKHEIINLNIFMVEVKTKKKIFDLEYFSNSSVNNWHMRIRSRKMCLHNVLAKKKNREGHNIF